MLRFDPSIDYRLASSETRLQRKQQWINTLRPRRNEQHFTDDIFKRIFFNENVWISIKISLKFVPKGPINNIPALVQIMAWRRSGDKPLSEPMVVSLPTHICVTRPQWVQNETVKSHLYCYISTFMSLNSSWILRFFIRLKTRTWRRNLLDRGIYRLDLCLAHCRQHNGSPPYVAPRRCDELADHHWTATVKKTLL